LIAGPRISPGWLFVLPAILLGAPLERDASSALPRRRGCGDPLQPGEALERIDVVLLREAGKQIDMAAYVLTDSAVIEALRDALARGEKVRVWRDASGAACCSKRRDSLGLSVRS